jgi:Icc protein
MRPTRRQFLHASAAMGAATLLPSWGRIGAADAAGRLVPMRIVHLSDIHMRPDLGAAKALAKCLEKVHALRPRPALVLTGGDLVHDARNDTRDGAAAKFKLAKSVLKDCDFITRHCIGNHDCFGWGPKSTIAKDHAEYGKKMYQDIIGVDHLNYGSEFGGWHICVVDNILPTHFDDERGYQGGFDEATMDWLDKQFTAAKRPKLLLTHIPITSAAALGYTNDTTKKHRELPTSLICRNAFEILELLNKHKVELVLTGHLHQRERTKYQHTTHIGQGAVCGQWWKGPNRGSAEGFGVLDIHPNGTFSHEYVTYDWSAVKPASTE